MGDRRSATGEVAGVVITHPERIVFASATDRTRGITKQQLAEYMARMAPWMLPHVVDRPVSLVRCPQGQSGACFYQKHWTGFVPDGLETVEVIEDSGERAPYIVIRETAGLVSLVQHGVLEVHPWGARTDHLDAPDRAIFDLDPAPDVPWARVVATAQATRALLRSLGLSSWVKLTGGKGVHVVVPIAPTSTWSDLHDFVRLVTARLMTADPDGLIDKASKAARAGRIFVDYLRNGRGATAVAPWSPRARPGAPVAIPITWTELDTLSGPDAVTVDQIERWRVAHPRNPWSALLRRSQPLTETIMRELMQPTTTARPERDPLRNRVREQSRRGER